ncbi:hypothetical protein PG991_014967 [Apiospora marii]|uniref:Uncharacterized protein n=1 Tax=Apiospora marii TaxID=335849 RepID=A0ABR1R2V4_9PEZI
MAIIDEFTDIEATIWIGDRPAFDELAPPDWLARRHRKEKLETWRDIHFEYESKRHTIMRTTYGRLNQENYEVKMESD